MSQVTSKPYIEQIFEKHGTDEKYLIRTFSSQVSEDELVWHKDKSGRKVHILSGNGWGLQHDDELPNNIKKGGEYHIQRESYHRLIKGHEDLVVRIENI